LFLEASLSAMSISCQRMFGERQLLIPWPDRLRFPRRVP
jgi:hypothetical protein